MWRYALRSNEERRRHRLGLSPELPTSSAGTLRRLRLWADGGVLAFRTYRTTLHFTLIADFVFICILPSSSRLQQPSARISQETHHYLLMFSVCNI